MMISTWMMSMKNFKTTISMLKRIIILFFFIIIIFSGKLYAQSEENSDWSASIGSDIVSRYIWRGISSSKTPALQPYLEVSYKGVTLGTWASYTMGEETLQEVDLYISYSLGNFTLTISDYFVYEDTLASSSFYNYDENTTSHILDAQLSFEGPESFPIKATLSTLVYGADKNINGDKNYSTYIELGYPFIINDISIMPFAGAALNSGLYNSKAGFINCGITGEAEINITENFSIPLGVSLITNPLDENVFVVVKLSF